MDVLLYILLTSTRRNIFISGRMDACVYCHRYENILKICQYSMAMEIYHHCVLCNLTSVYFHTLDSLLGYYVHSDEYFPVFFVQQTFSEPVHKRGTYLLIDNSISFKLILSIKILFMFTNLFS